MYPYFEIFGRTIGTYAVCALVGFLICGFVAGFICIKQKIQYEDLILLMISAIIGLFLGGHILYALTNLTGIANVFANFSNYTLYDFFIKMVQYFGGMVFYGGFLGAYAAILIHTKFSNGISRCFALDLFALLTPLFHTFARIGCFLGGCCYGKESSWGFIIHGNTLNPSINNILRIPVQLIEAGCNFLIFLVLLMIFKKWLNKGFLIYVYLIFYPTVRFILEFFRGDEIRGFLFGLSTSQWISIILFMFALTNLLMIKKNNK